MKLGTKVLIITLAISLCAGGVFLSQKGKTEDKQPKSKVVPIDNREQDRAEWIWA